MSVPKNALALALETRWEKFNAELETCKTEFSEEGVHDLRVATRRLLAGLDMLRSLEQHPRVRKVRRTLKDQIDALDDLRDTQVMLVDVSEALGELPDLKVFEEYLLKREKKLLRSARKEILELPVSELKKQVKKSQLWVEENIEGETGTARLLSVVDQSYSKALQALGEIDAAQPASIHHFRIAFKKFRYMVEIIQPALKDLPETYFKALHDYQSRMGDVQDVEVFMQSLAGFAKETQAKSALEPARLFFEQRRAELVAAFIQGQAEIRGFWRATAEQNFPWESGHEPVHRSSRDRSGGGDA